MKINLKKEDFENSPKLLKTLPNKIIKNIEKKKNFQEGKLKIFYYLI